MGNEDATSDGLVSGAFIALAPATAEPDEPMHASLFELAGACQDTRAVAESERRLRQPEGADGYNDFLGRSAAQTDISQQQWAEMIVYVESEPIERGDVMSRLYGWLSALAEKKGDAWRRSAAHLKSKIFALGRKFLVCQCPAR